MQAIRQQCLRSITYLLTAGLLLTLGCGKNPAGPMNLVVFETIAGCSGMGSAEPFQGKILDQQSWEVLWNKYCTGIILIPPPPTTIPPIDFSKEMVIGLFYGHRSNSCYHFQIRTIEDTRDKYIVHAVETVEERTGTICLPTIISLHHLVKTVRRDVPIEFVVTQEVVR